MTEQPTDVKTTMEAARAALEEKDWEAVRRLLAPVVAENPHGVAAFQLARAELEMGRPETAAPLVTAFKAWRPKHVGARVLAARVHLANGDVEDAETEATLARELDPDRQGIDKLLSRVAAARRVSDLDNYIAVIDEQHRDARVNGPTPELREAVRRLAQTDPGPDWTRDPRQARVAFFHFAHDLDWAVRNYDPHLVEISAEFDYITWPKRIQEYVRGRSVLDVGCGFGGFGMGFLVAGTRAYAGLDPAMELDSSRAKNKRVRAWADMGTTPREIAAALPAIRLFQSTSEDTSFDETFETIALHNVTEHLADLESVLRGLIRLCTPDTYVVLHHHNFYCWNGHHLPPNQPAQLDPENARHQQVYDWRHINLVPQLDPEHYIMTNLNRVRLDEFRRITEDHFDIVRWDEVPSSEPTLQRLTPEVMERVRSVLPDITERELSVNAVFAVARPKG